MCSVQGPTYKNPDLVNTEAQIDLQASWMVVWELPLQAVFQGGVL